MGNQYSRRPQKKKGVASNRESSITKNHMVKIVHQLPVLFVEQVGPALLENHIDGHGLAVAGLLEFNNVPALKVERGGAKLKPQLFAIFRLDNA